ncbi:MAG: hypothetical protein GF317_01600 [Candidatus Lokiarchaeota archaeon]|nr:hypothetical protein [Candidatus Lokiarchaeota archaeon]MBD3198639.1 hypothetical protein [Candidatus Lokiarchaeota archaeon]
MDDKLIQDLKEKSEIEDLINTINPYFPGLDINDYKIEEIERSLYHIYIKLIGRILSYSPENMRDFLRDFLLKYEIMNLKEIILGTIIGISISEKKKNINFTIEKYLDNREFMENLVEIPTLDEIQLFLRTSKYNRPVREGIAYFRNTNEIFVLESFLDQLYYQNLMKNTKIYDQYEKEMIGLFSKYITEIYNINIIYRGIINRIDKKLLSQFLVDNHLFLEKEVLLNLLENNNLKSFFNMLKSYLLKVDGLKGVKRLREDLDHPIWVIEELYQNYYFQKFELKIDNIAYSTIYRIFELIIKKEKEIKREIMPNVIRILHEKFTIFEGQK